MTKQNNEAVIKIDTDRIIDDIDPRIYGIFMEPIGINREGSVRNTLYGPVYDPDSPQANEDGFIIEYIEAAKELRLTNMRWPGGNFTANYDWMDGIGPGNNRPVRKELAWGVNESNQVGTDEWIKLNKAIGSENVVCFNMGTGTLKEACAWVEYCNGEQGTYYADLRAKYGNPEPYAVKYWCLGNEVDGEPWIIAYRNSEDYCKLAREIAKAVKKIDPSVSLIANGASNYKPNMDWVEWDWKVINALRGQADFLSVHRYWEYSEDYYEHMGRQAIELEEKIAVPAALAKTVQSVYRMEKPMFISFDEWAPIGPHIGRGGGHRSTLAAAQFFNAFIRHADMVKMANYTLLTSILAFDPQSNRRFRSPFFYTFKMYSNNCHGTSIDSMVKCGTFDVDDKYRNVPYLDVSTVLSADRKTLILNVVNRHKEESINTEIINCSKEFNKEAIVWEVCGEDLEQPYEYAEKDAYMPEENTLLTKGRSISYSFPPHSFSQIVFGCK